MNDLAALAISLKLILFIYIWVGVGGWYVEYYENLIHINMKIPFQ